MSTTLPTYSGPATIPPPEATASNRPIIDPAVSQVTAATASTDTGEGLDTLNVSVWGLELAWTTPENALPHNGAMGDRVYATAQTATDALYAQTRFLKLPMTAGNLYGLDPYEPREVRVLWRGRLTGGGTDAYYTVEDMVLCQADGSVICSASVVLAGSTDLYDCLNRRIAAVSDSADSDSNGEAIADLSGVSLADMDTFHASGGYILIRWRIWNANNPGNLPATLKIDSVCPIMSCGEPLAVPSLLLYPTAQDSGGWTNASNLFGEANGTYATTLTNSSPAGQSGGTASLYFTPGVAGATRILGFDFTLKGVSGSFSDGAPYIDSLTPLTTGTFGVTGNNTITRAAGSWVTDGFTAGMPIVTNNFTDAANNGSFVVQSVTSTNLVVTVTSLVAESGTGNESVRIANGSDAVGLAVVPFDASNTNRGNFSGSLHEFAGWTQDYEWRRDQAGTPSFTPYSVDSINMFGYGGDPPLTTSQIATISDFGGLRMKSLAATADEVKNRQVTLTLDTVALRIYITPQPVGTALNLTTTGNIVQATAASLGLTANADWGPEVAFASFTTQLATIDGNRRAASTVQSAGTFGVSGTSTFTRAAGSWVTDGYVAGHTIVTYGFTAAANNGTFTVQSVTANNLVVTATTLVAESGDGDEMVVSHRGQTRYLVRSFTFPSDPGSQYMPKELRIDVTYSVNDASFSGGSTSRPLYARWGEMVLLSSTNVVYARFSTGQDLYSLRTWKVVADPWGTAYERTVTLVLNLRGLSVAQRDDLILNGGKIGLVGFMQAGDALGTPTVVDLVVNALTNPQYVYGLASPEEVGDGARSRARARSR